MICNIKLLVNIVWIIVAISAIDLEKNLLKTWKNNSFYGFRGIKFGESPTGVLRFKAPLPIRSWGNISFLFEQTLDKDGNECPLPEPPADFYNEDCLFLNVYTKSLKPSNLRPVIVFIHHGGLYLGSGNSDHVGAEYLLEENVVLVTFNYRLAYFGFTSVGTADAIGNAGFKDQVLALKWVRDHIEWFGGNPQLVTLMGYSAGGMSVALHLVSPVSRGLFHRAFAMSGSILPQTKLPTAQLHLVNKLAQLIRCKENSFECIKKGDTRLITESLRQIFEFGWDNPVFPWLPIIEPRIEGEEPFLDRDPFQQLRHGYFARVPIMISTTQNELSSSAMQLFERRDWLLHWLNDFQRVGPICLQYEANVNISSELRKHYIGDFNLASLEHLFDQTAQCFSDGLINFPAYRLAHLTRNFTDVFYMKFTFNGSFTSFACNSNINANLCNEIKHKNMIEHTDDLQYLFNLKNYPKITYNDASDECKIVEKYTKLLFKFATNGYPEFGIEIDVNAAKFDDTQAFINFGKTFKLETMPFKSHRIWDRLFPI